MAITWKWNGTAIEATRSSSAVWSILEWEVGPLRFRPRVQRLDMQQGECETLDPLPEYARDWRIVLKIDASGVTGASPTNETRQLDAWREAAAFWAPLDGTGTLLATSANTSGTTIERGLLCNVLSVPQFAQRSGDPKGLSASGAYDVGGSPYLVYVVEGDTRFPYWISDDLLTTDTTPATAELAVSLATDTVTINNPFDRWVGVKFTVKNGSVSGAVDEVTITNNTNGSTLTFLDDSGTMDNNEYIDWYASNPLTHSRSADWSIGAGPNNLYLSPGNNELESIITGVGAGSLTLSVAWPELSYTM